MSRTIPSDVWQEIARHWRFGSDSVAAIARRYDIHVSTITRHARRQGWPPRTHIHPDPSHDPTQDPRRAAEVLLTDLTIELQHSLKRLRENLDTETITNARERTRLIRETHRALALRAKIETPERAAPAPSSASAHLDLAAADRDILDHLARLDRAEQKAPDDPSSRPAA